MKLDKSQILLKSLQNIKTICNESFKIKCFEKDQNLASKLLNCFLIQIRYDMFSDLQRSNEDSQNFKEILSQSSRDTIDLDILVLTFEQWPITDFQPFIIHTELLNLQQQFTQYYQCKNSKRKLTFNYRLGSVSLKAIFDQNCKKDFVCTFYKQTILMYFNRQRIYKIDELIKLTNQPILTKKLCNQNWRILNRLNYQFIMKKGIHQNQTKNSNIEVKKLRSNQKNNKLFLQVRNPKLNYRNSKQIKKKQYQIEEFIWNL